MEYGHFKRRDRDDYRDRDRDRRDFRDRGGFRGRERNNDRDRDRDHEESVFSKRVRAGKRRTYFFDVRKTRGDDFFITMTESTRREDGYGYKRHKIFLYKEDFNRFLASLNEVVEHVKTELMPDFDYEEFDRRQAEWEAQREAEDAMLSDEDDDMDDNDDDAPKKSPKSAAKDADEAGDEESKDDDDWPSI
ncbi:MAG: DUF3276 family protein [Bacteroidetes bacterium]|nr:MAG: DUF3276 family protein [Bacteroidota bacterium]